MSEGNELPRSVLFKNLIADKPWLYIIARFIKSYPGLTIEELKEASKLKIDVVKRGVWWLKKYGIIEEKNGKLFITREYSDIMESMIYNTCSIGDYTVLLLDKVYLVYLVRKGKIEYWSLPVDYYEKIKYYENITGGTYTPSEIASILGVDPGTARRVHLLIELLRQCKPSQTRGSRS